MLGLKLNHVSKRGHRSCCYNIATFGIANDDEAGIIIPSKFDWRKLLGKFQKVVKMGFYELTSPQILIYVLLNIVIIDLDNGLLPVQWPNHYLKQW